MRRMWMFPAVTILLVAVGLPVCTQAQDSPPTNPNAAPYEVHAGTRFLVSLHDKLSTKTDKAGKHFTARTLESIKTADGTTLPAGAEVRGHLDKVVAGKIDRARIWLAFDDIQTPDGWAPLVAELIDAPDIHSLHVAYDHEGEIEATSSTRKTAEQAAAAGALAGAATGMAARDTKMRPLALRSVPPQLTW